MMRPVCLAVALVAVVCAAAPIGAERLTKNVILVTLDGVRMQEIFGGLDEIVARAIVKKGRAEDTPLWERYWAPTAEERRRTLMPFFWGTLMSRGGSIAGNQAAGSVVRVTNQQWFSYPGYSEIATGAAHDAEIDSNDNRRNPFTSVLEVVRRERRLDRREVATFASWETFRWIVEHEEGATTVNAGLQRYEHPDRDIQVLSDWQFQARTPWDGTRHDAYTIRFARAHLASYHPRLLWIALDETDDWAHDGRYDRVLDTLARVDAALAELWAWLQSDRQYRGATTLLLTTDHGRGRGPQDWKDHGKDVQGAQDIWLAIAGPDATRRGEWRDAPPVYQNQIAATIAQWLGVDFRRFVPDAAQALPDCLMQTDGCEMQPSR